MKVLLWIFLGTCPVSCHTQTRLQNPATDEGAIAFPGAEGFGKYTTGGRGGTVFIVSNLNDNGAGSLREAVESNKKRIIVFAVSGTIHLESRLNIKGNCTIAGQSAPGDGICIADHPVGLTGDNIIVRFIRFRMGDRYQNKGMVDGGGSDDAFGGVRRKNIIIDHCSMSWSTDEVCSVYAGDSTTLQWNLISEPLDYSYHFETGDKDFERHGYGGIWGGKHLSAHHNLFAHCNSRNPRFDGIRNSPEENCDYRNNVIYNWGSNNIYAGEGGNYNIVNNYFKYGPSTSKAVRYRIVNPGKRESPFIPFGKWYVHGNYVDEAPDISENNGKGVHMGNNASEEDRKQSVVNEPHPAENINMQSAKDAYNAVISKVGCSLPVRDTLDQRIIDNVKNRTGKFIDVQGGFPHGTAYELTKEAWPGLRSLPPAPDSDKDGMPDSWEKMSGLDPHDASDAAANKLDKFFTNIEVYLNSLVK
jgi:pectate lyase